MTNHSIIPAWKIPQTEDPGRLQSACSHFNCVRLFATLWTITHQTPLWDSPGKNTGVGCHFLLEGIFPTQRSNLHLLCLSYLLCIGRWVLYHCGVADTTERPTLRSRCVRTWPGVQGQQTARINNRSATGVPPDSRRILLRACKTHLPRAYLA